MAHVHPTPQLSIPLFCVVSRILRWSSRPPPPGLLSLHNPVKMDFTSLIRLCYMAHLILPKEDYLGRSDLVI